MLGIGDLARLGGVSTRTLRHYAELGVLEPARVDASTGYRSYRVDQLAALHRVIALRELGLGLDAIRKLIADDIPLDEVRGMLRLRRVEIAEAIDAEHERLRRVEAHLDAIERGGAMDTVDVVIKQGDPLRVAAYSGRVAGYGYEHINPFFQEHLERISVQLLDQGLRFGPCVAFYEEDGDDVVVHLGWEIGEQAVVESDGIRVHELPAVEVASTVHRGSMAGVLNVVEAMVRWIETAGYELAGPGRELYRQLDIDESRQVTELQFPVVQATTPDRREPSGEEERR